MFCFQCEQTAGCKGCAGKIGVCGKNADTAEIQDKLTGSLIGLARATEGNDHMVSDSTAAVIVEGLFATLTNVNFDNDALLTIIDKVDAEKQKLVPECYKCASSCGRNNDYDMSKLWNADEDIRSITVTRMTVPCCGGLSHAVKTAVANSGKNIPLHIVTISPDGQIIV